MKRMLNRISGREGLAAFSCMGLVVLLIAIARLDLLQAYHRSLESLIQRRIAYRFPFEAPITGAEGRIYEILPFVLLCLGIGFAVSALRHGPARNRWAAVSSLAVFLGIVGFIIHVVTT